MRRSSKPAGRCSVVTLMSADPLINSRLPTKVTANTRGLNVAQDLIQQWKPQWTSLLIAISTAWPSDRVIEYCSNAFRFARSNNPTSRLSRHEFHRRQMSSQRVGQSGTSQFAFPQTPTPSLIRILREANRVHIAGKACDREEFRSRGGCHGLARVLTLEL